MRDPNPNFTPQEAEEARAYLREHGGDVQQRFNQQADEGGEQLFIVTDTLNEQEAAERSAREGKTIPAGEDILYVTDNDELIVDYWRHLLKQPLHVGQDMPDMQAGTFPLPEGGHRKQG